MSENIKVFISWSGPQSQKIAELLREWLKYPIRGLQPWMSSEDISAGTSWGLELDARLDDCRFGIICLTPDNLNAPWIHFEAGALAGRFRRDGTSVCPYLYALNLSDVRGPLSRFQAVLANEEGTRKMLAAMNDALGTDRLQSDVLKTVFDRWWPDLDAWLKGVPSVGQKASAKAPESPEQSESKLTRDVLVPKSFASMAREGNVEQAIDQIRKLLPKGDYADLDQNELEEKIVTLLLLSTNPVDWDRAADYVVSRRDPKYYLRLAYKFWTVQQLDNAIRWAEGGLPLAVDRLDRDLIAKFQNSLAYYYAESGTRNTMTNPGIT